MSDTRNRNTPLNYKNEKRKNNHVQEYHQLYGTAYKTNLCGNGLLHGRLPREQLSNNPIDTESFLFGINSTNLEEKQDAFVPQLNTLSNIDLFQNTPIIMPEPLICEGNQRPLHK